MLSTNSSSFVLLEEMLLAMNSTQELVWSLRRVAEKRTRLESRTSC
jgi:hypothetical protein